MTDIYLDPRYDRLAPWFLRISDLDVPVIAANQNRQDLELAADYFLQDDDLQIIAEQIKPLIDAAKGKVSSDTIITAQAAVKVLENMAWKRF
jgi:hypothetical protein